MSSTSFNLKQINKEDIPPNSTINVAKKNQDMISLKIENI